MSSVLHRTVVTTTRNPFHSPSRDFVSETLVTPGPRQRLSHVLTTVVVVVVVLSVFREVKPRVMYEKGGPTNVIRKIVPISLLTSSKLGLS